jgi:hypothetical protein
VPKIKIKGLNLKFKQGITQTTTQADNAPQSTYKLLLGEIDLSKIAVDYQDDTNKLSATISLKKGLVKFDKTDFTTIFSLLMSSIYQMQMEKLLSLVNQKKNS